MEDDDEELQRILDADENMLPRLDWDKQRSDFLSYLETEEQTIKRLIAHHLTLRRDQVCRVADRSEWKSGSFNICIPVSIANWQPQRVLIRCPLPQRFNTLHPTDLIDEKIRCEAASYAWISENCTHVPIPTLRGFGLPNGLSCLPWYQRMWEVVKRSIRRLWGPLPWRPFVPSQFNVGLRSGYLLIDFVEKTQGQLLYDRFYLDQGKFPTSEKKRAFLESLSRIMIDIGRPMDKIGSVTVHDSGEVSLNNRPLTSSLVMLDSNGIPTMSRTTCYTSTDSYVNALLDCHDSRLEHQPNAARDESDAKGQMAVVVMLRALFSRLTQRSLRNGPFIFQLTDLNVGNIFVDEEYRITAVCDLEWSCSLPMEMQQPPLWLCDGYGLDDFREEHDDERNKKEMKLAEFHDTFLEIFARESVRMGASGSIDRTAVMRSALQKRSHWYFAGLRNPDIAYDVFLTLLQPQMAPEQLYGKGASTFQRTLAPYWINGTSAFTSRKCQELDQYKRQIRSAYQHKQLAR